MENETNNQNTKKPIGFTECYDFIESMDRKFLLKIYQDAIEEPQKSIEHSLNKELEYQPNDQNLEK